MQVACLEAGGINETLPVPDLQIALGPFHQFVLAQLLKHAVDMDGGDPDGLAEHRLRDGEAEGVVVNEADRLEAGVKLAEQMCDTPVGFPLPDVEEPFARDRGLDKGVAP